MSASDLGHDSKNPRIPMWDAVPVLLLWPLSYYMHWPVEVPAEITAFVIVIELARISRKLDTLFDLIAHLPQRGP